MSRKWFTCEISPSGRAVCRGCNEKISKGELRISLSYEHDGHEMFKWHHMDCIDKLPKGYDLQEPEQTEGWDRLSSENKNKLTELIQKLRNAVPETKSTKKDKKSQRKKNQSDESDDGKEFIDVDEVKPKAYSEEQWKVYKEYRAELHKKKIAGLQLILKANNQLISGKKPELIERIADGKVQGAIPNCPHCGGGKPKYNMKADNYKCPGYMEDTDFRRCGKVLRPEDIQRTKWEDE